MPCFTNLQARIWLYQDTMRQRHTNSTNQVIQIRSGTIDCTSTKNPIVLIYNSNHLFVLQT